jgi:50S ribosomal subunit-associated GTPase HflX
MTKDNGEKKITIDDVEYKLEDLSDSAREQLTNIQFVDAQLQQLNNEWAVSDTARIGYTNALKAELAKIEDSE